MIRSMTGFGNAVVQAGNKTLSIDIRSLNSKQLDINLRISSGLRERESLIRTEIARALERGKIDLSIQQKTLETSSGQLNIPLIRDRYHQLRTLAADLGINDEGVFSLAVSLPESQNSSADEIADDEWPRILEGIQQAISNLDDFRIREGDGLKTDLLERVHSIRQILSQIETCEPERINSIRTRLQNRFEELAPALQVSGNRFEEELIFYLEKLDISEEKQRLNAHCNYFIACMDEQGNQGRKLAFISQEMGREINTIGSKANHADMQKMVVLMKDELEKIKEQLNNVL